MRNLIFFTLLILLPVGLMAQDNQQAFGIRGGLSSGFEYRVFTNEYSSYKVLLSTRDRGLQVAGMKEFHQFDMFDFSEQLSFIYGFGLHVGYERWDVSKYHNGYHSWNTRSGPIAGLDGLVAVEYNFWEVPLSLGFEVKPFFDMFGRKLFRVQPFDFAFTLKYNF